MITYYITYVKIVFPVGVWLASKIVKKRKNITPQVEKKNIVGTSLSEPHFNVLNGSGVRMYVCIYAFVHRTVNTFVFVE